MRTLVLALLFCAGCQVVEQAPPNEAAPPATVTFSVTVRGRVFMPEGRSANNNRHNGGHIHVYASADPYWGCGNAEGLRWFQQLHPDLPKVSVRGSDIVASNKDTFEVKVEVTLQGGKPPLREQEDGTSPRQYAAIKLTAKWRAACVVTENLLLIDGQDQEDLALRMSYWGRVSVRVQDAEGKPAPGVPVELWWRAAVRGIDHPLASATTSRTGIADIWVRPGDCRPSRLEVGDPGLRISRPVELHPGYNDVEEVAATVLPAGICAGRVVDWDDGGPVAASLTLKQGDVAMKRTARRDGTFQFGSLTPGAYTLAVAAKHYEDREIPVEVSAGQTLDLGDLVLGPGRGIHIRMQDPPHGAHVTLIPRPRAGWEYPFSLKSGRITIDRLEPGRHEVIVSAPAHADWRRTVELSDAPVLLKPVLEPGQRIRLLHVNGITRGTVEGTLILHGTPPYERYIEGGIAALETRPAEQEQGWVAPWTAEPHATAIPSGTWMAVARLPSGRTAVRDYLRLEPGRGTTDVYMFDPSHVIEVRVMYEGKPVAYCNVHLLHADPDASQRMSTNEHGIVRFTRVFPDEQVIAFDDELHWQRELASGTSAATWPVANRAVTFEPGQTERRITLERNPAALAD